MGNKILEFFELNTARKQEAIKIANGEYKSDLDILYSPVVKFFLTGYKDPGGLNVSITRMDSVLITLDEEDIQYFENKYVKKLDEERMEKINKINQEYDKLNK